MTTKVKGIVSPTVTDTLTLLVPSQYSTIQAAFDSLKQYSFAENGNAVIQVADGTYTGLSSITLNHVDGDKISVLGNTTTPASCVLQFTSGATDAIAVTNGHNLGYLDGFTIQLAAKATSAAPGTGILATNGSKIILGQHVVVNNFYYGVAARAGSFILADYVTVSNAGDVGIWSFCGSHVEANYASSTLASDTTNSLGFGFQAEYGGVLNCSGAIASGCYKAGIAALSGGVVRALGGANSSNNTGSGFYTIESGVIEAHSCIANTNTRYGFESIGTPGIFANGATLTGNTIAAQNPIAAFDNSTANGARLVASAGALRLDAADGSSIYFNTSGGLQFEVEHIASAVNHAAVRGNVAGNSPVLEVIGSDTNVDLQLRGKGIGDLLVCNSQANYIRLKGATVGNGVTVTPEGSDANIDLKLNPKGTGALQVGVASAAATTPASFSAARRIAIKDSTGTVYYIPCAAAPW